MNVKLTRGLAAAAISAAMMVGTAVPALADENVKTLPNDGGYYLTKTYNGVSDGTVSETLHFTVTNYKFTDTNASVTTENMPTVSIDDVSATSGQDNQVKLKFSKPYTSAGYYYYTVKETEGNTAGVEYNDKTYYLKVTVSYGKDGAANIDSVSLWDADPTVDKQTADHKVTGIANTYKSGTLEVKKVIAGNLAQKEAEFKIKVTFTSTKPVGSIVSYTVDGKNQSIATTDWTPSEDKKTYTASRDITVKGGSTVDFSNLPNGVTYSVEETDSGDNYTSSIDNPSGTLTATDEKIDATTTVTNTKNSVGDFGVILNNAPYIVILGGVAVAAIYFVSHRRSNED